MFDPRVVFSKQYLDRQENKAFVERIKQRIERHPLNVAFNIPRLLLQKVSDVLKRYISFVRAIHTQLVDMTGINWFYWPIVSYVGMRLGYEFSPADTAYAFLALASFAIAHFVDRLRITCLEDHKPTTDEEVLQMRQLECRAYRVLFFFVSLFVLGSFISGTF